MSWVLKVYWNILQFNVLSVSMHIIIYFIMSYLSNGWQLTKLLHTLNVDLYPQVATEIVAFCCITIKQTQRAEFWVKGLGELAAFNNFTCD